MARTNSDFGSARTSVSRPTGTIIAPPQPCRTRHATNRWMLRLKPHSSEPSANRPMAPANTRRVPNRFAIQPLTGMNTARLRV